MGALQIPGGWEVSPRVRERLGRRSVGRQRAIFEEEELLLVLHEAPRGGREREGALFWRDAKGQWRSAEERGGLPVLKAHVAEYGREEDRLSQDYEAASGAGDYFELLEALGPLQRAAKNLYDSLQNAREAIPDDRDIIDLRDEAYDSSRALELLYLDTRNALDFEIARKTEEQIRLSRRSLLMEGKLNTVAAVFLPLTAVGGIFGMNLVSGLEASSWAFWAIFAGGLLVGLVLRGWAGREPRSSDRPQR